jgi:demethylmenaquinone methyltransferase/2-methoxy-6-polyprenyl-1,4-benzoquinol methylase
VSAAYYARRATAYERIYARPERQGELRELEAALPAEFVGRRGLEVACGTGWWTPHGARDAAYWLATDVNPETLTIARQKPLPACVTVARGDSFDLTAGAFDSGFDAAFTGFWWSHVRRLQMPAWLTSLHTLLPPGAKLAFIGNLFVEGSSTPISRTDEAGNTYPMRSLDDGSQHEVLKNFPSADEAVAMLGPRALRPRWLALQHFWMLRYELA